jgi:hypothetical protein
MTIRTPPPDRIPGNARRARRATRTQVSTTPATRIGHALMNGGTRSTSPVQSREREDARGTDVAISRSHEELHGDDLGDHGDGEHEGVGGADPLVAAAALAGEGERGRLGLEAGEHARRGDNVTP